MAVAEDFSAFKPQPISHISGPNCWNQALISVGLLEINRFTSAEEFKYLLNKHCSLTNTPQVNSLGRMNDKFGEVHAFIWISDTEVFAKNSMGGLELPGFMPLQEMLSTYLFDEDCLKNNTNKDQCKRDISYYNCTPIDLNILAQQNQLQPLELTLHEILYSSETMARPRMNCTSEPVNNRFIKLEKFLSQLRRIKKANLNEFEYFKTWLKSVDLQMDEIESSTYFENCQDSQYLKSFKVFDKINKEIKSLVNPK
jgi:hypothetical protein